METRSTAESKLDDRSAKSMGINVSREAVDRSQYVEDDVLSETMYFASRRGRPDTPESSLMVAILFDALTILAHRRPSTTHAKAILETETRDWLNGENGYLDDSLYSSRNICEFFGIEIGAIRRRFGGATVNSPAIRRVGSLMFGAGASGRALSVSAPRERSRR